MQSNNTNIMSGNAFNGDVSGYVGQAGKDLTQTGNNNQKYDG